MPTTGTVWPDLPVHWLAQLVSPWLHQGSLFFLQGNREQNDWASLCLLSNFNLPPTRPEGAPSWTPPLWFIWCWPLSPKIWSRLWVILWHRPDEMFAFFLASVGGDTITPPSYMILIHDFPSKPHNYRYWTLHFCTLGPRVQKCKEDILRFMNAVNPKRKKVTLVAMSAWLNHVM
jgi:hypothetical protein